MPQPGRRSQRQVSNSTQHENGGVPHLQPKGVLSNPFGRTNQQQARQLQKRRDNQSSQGAVNPDKLTRERTRASCYDQQDRRCNHGHAKRQTSPPQVAPLRVCSSAHQLRLACSQSPVTKRSGLAVGRAKQPTWQSAPPLRTQTCMSAPATHVRRH
jgi:hypothetical protein